MKRVVIDLSFGLIGPAAGPPPSQEVLNAVKRLEERSYKTYKSRLEAQRRLRARNNAWNASLVAVATATTIASLGQLVDDRMYGAGGDALLVALAVLSLVASLVVASMNYGSRARDMESTYKSIQQVSLKAETFLADTRGDPEDRFTRLQEDYSQIVQATENHSDADYYRAYSTVAQGHRPRVLVDSFVSLTPYITLIVPVLLVVPFALWFARGT